MSFNEIQTIHNSGLKNLEATENKSNGGNQDFCG